MKVPFYIGKKIFYLINFLKKRKKYYICLKSKFYINMNLRIPVENLIKMTMKAC